MNGAAVLVECLKAEGVGLIFGYPGAAILPFYDKLCADGSIRHILVRHEQNAAHAASGFARASGKTGVCCATSGPGAVNLLTGLATAYMDSIPIVAITGQVSTEFIGRDVFQEADIVGACEPFTKYSYLVKQLSELPRIVREAFYIASSGRPGPVLIDLPCDVQRRELEGAFEYPKSVDIAGYKPRTTGHPLQIKRAAALIGEAERPVICAGGGVVSARARKELCAFAEGRDIPVVSTLMGVGVMPTEHRLFLGMLGTHGSAAANDAVRRADLLIFCGARVGDRSLARAGQISERARVIHIDVDPVEIGKNLRADVPIVGDIRLVLRELCAQSPEQHRESWVLLAAEKRRGYVSQSTRDGYCDPRFVLTALSQAASARGKAILTADVGQNQIWAANSFAFSGGRFLSSGGMGTMGYSLPAAIGAKLAKPSRQVIAVCGDGSFQMMLPELATAVREGVAVKIVVMNNGGLGMIRELQDKSCEGRRFAVELADVPDIQRLARAYGVECRRVCSNEEAPAAIARLLACRKPFILECAVDPELNSIGGAQP